MGMYTEIYVNVDLKPSTPPAVIATLQAMCGEGDFNARLLEMPSRWGYLFNNGSYYFPRTSCAHLTKDDLTNRYALLGKGDIKNYENEIERFFQWIAPWVQGEDGDFIGYMRYEENQLPTIIVLDGQSVKELHYPTPMVGTHPAL